MTGVNGERTEDGERTGDGLRRRRRRTVAVVVAGALLATAVGLWATDTRPSRADSYCWGAWQEHEIEGLLGGGALDDAVAVSTESPPPTAAHPEGTCEMTVREKSGTERDIMSVTAAYGRFPADEHEHRERIARYLHGSAAALPDGLDGAASPDHALLVLPAACDVGGRPTTVTLSGEARDESVMARLLVDLANTAMEKAGCAPDAPPTVTSPFTELPRSDRYPHYPRLCGIPGMAFDKLPGGAGGVEITGTYGNRLQICSLDFSSRSAGTGAMAHYVMAGTPRLAALFTGFPEGPGRRLVRTTCDGRPTVFYAQPDLLTGRGVPDDETVFTRFRQSVSKRVGCDDGGER
ncbi:hypothetical protein [Streptomyces thermolilacinus]|uniref:hypothetical protein n=1 Tax=Streptomyces thermolilacinus TaxID=285540 RepID=UPI0033E896E6